MSHTMPQDLSSKRFYSHDRIHRFSIQTTDHDYSVRCPLEVKYPTDRQKRMNMCGQWATIEGM